MKNGVYTCHFSSPLGEITLSSDGESLTGLRFGREERAENPDLPVFRETVRWLDLYFAGKIPDFTPPLRLIATPFCKSVCRLLLTVPYGQTTTYGKIAEEIARQRGIARMSAQAVGGAVGRNPISLIIPCHRVVGSDGSLTGYAWGLERKAALLELERNNYHERLQNH